MTEYDFNSEMRYDTDINFAIGQYKNVKGYQYPDKYMDETETPVSFSDPEVHGGSLYAQKYLWKMARLLDQTDADTLDIYIGADTPMVLVGKDGEEVVMLATIAPRIKEGELSVVDTTVPPEYQRRPSDDILEDAPRFKTDKSIVAALSTYDADVTNSAVQNILDEFQSGTGESVDVGVGWSAAKVTVKAEAFYRTIRMLRAAESDSSEWVIHTDGGIIVRSEIENSEQEIELFMGDTTFKPDQSWTGDSILGDGDSDTADVDADTEIDTSADDERLGGQREHLWTCYKIGVGGDVRQNTLEGIWEASTCFVKIAKINEEIGDETRAPEKLIETKKELRGLIQKIDNVLESVDFEMDDGDAGVAQDALGDIEDRIKAEIKQLDDGDGADYKAIVQNMDETDDERIDEAINDMLGDGTIYERKPGKLKVL